MENQDVFLQTEFLNIIYTNFRLQREKVSIQGYGILHPL
jgi:hypothetical protein